MLGGDPPVRKDCELNVDRMSKLELDGDGCRSVRHGNRLARPRNRRSVALAAGIVPGVTRKRRCPLGGGSPGPETVAGPEVVRQAAEQKVRKQKACEQR